MKTRGKLEFRNREHTSLKFLTVVMEDSKRDMNLVYRCKRCHKFLSAAYYYKFNWSHYYKCYKCGATE